MNGICDILSLYWGSCFLLTIGLLRSLFPYFIQPLKTTFRTQHLTLLSWIGVPFWLLYTELIAPCVWILLLLFTAPIVAVHDPFLQLHTVSVPPCVNAPIYANPVHVSNPYWDSVTAEFRPYLAPLFAAIGGPILLLYDQPHSLLQVGSFHCHISASRAAIHMPPMVDCIIPLLRLSHWPFPTCGLVVYTPTNAIILVCFWPLAWVIVATIW